VPAVTAEQKTRTPPLGKRDARAMRANRLKLERAIEPLARSTRRRAAAPTPCPPGRDSVWHLCDSYKNRHQLMESRSSPDRPTGLGFQSALFRVGISTFCDRLGIKRDGAFSARGGVARLRPRRYYSMYYYKSNSSTPAPACARTHAGLCPHRRWCRTPRTSPRSRRRRTRCPRAPRGALSCPVSRCR